MKKKQFTNVIIADASSSMGDKVTSVRNGLKELFKDIKAKAKADPDVRFKTIVVSFSSHDDIQILVNATGTAGLTKKLAESYSVRGMTALYDAIGAAFKLVGSDEKNVFVNIFTDGEENNSRVFSQGQVKSLIAEAKDKGWGITFMGTTEDAINNAVAMGISRGNTVVYANNAGGAKKMSSARNKMSAMYFSAAVGGASLDVNDLSSTVDDELKDGK